MIILSLCSLAVIFNFILYFIFGSLITGNLRSHRFSATLSVIMGFFLYYVMFEAVCIPVMVMKKPLHLLAWIWAGVVVIVTVVSFACCRKRWIECFRGIKGFAKEHVVFCIISTAIILIECVVIIYCYQFTLDAAYYVGTASTSLTTDMINIYNPYTGMWQDHFEMRYFFSNYAINDAVMCFLFKMHPLIWTKIIMEAVVIILSNLVLYRLGRAMFKYDLKRTGVFLFFSALLCFFYSTIYTAQEFFVTRTFEGKTIVGSVVIPLVFLVYIKLLEDHRDRSLWIELLIVSFASVVLSNSASMIFPAALFIFMIPLFFIKKDFRILIKSFAVVIPCLISVFMYVMYVKGYFVIRTI